MNQTIAAKRMGIKRATFSGALNYGPSDAVVLRFCQFTGVKPSEIDESLNAIIPIEVEMLKESA